MTHYPELDRATARQLLPGREAAIWIRCAPDSGSNRRLLDVQKISHDCSIGEDAFDKVVRPIEVEGQRAAALRFGDPRVQALFAVLVVFSLQLRGFTNQEMRALLAQLLSLDPANYPLGRMTYDLMAVLREAGSGGQREDWQDQAADFMVNASISRVDSRHSNPQHFEISGEDV